MNLRWTYSRLKGVVQVLTAWAWSARLSQAVADAQEETAAAKRFATVKGLQLSMLEELFREKQGKISRLQAAYNERRSPMYEDMRKEQPIKDAESLAQSISVLAARAEAFRAKHGKEWRHSDGTVVGVPGDRPNVPVGEAWR